MIKIASLQILQTVPASVATSDIKVQTIIFNKRLKVFRQFLRVSVSIQKSNVFQYNLKKKIPTFVATLNVQHQSLTKARFKSNCSQHLVLTKLEKLGRLILILNISPKR